MHQSKVRTPTSFDGELALPTHVQVQKAMSRANNVKAGEATYALRHSYTQNTSSNNGMLGSTSIDPYSFGLSSA